MNKKSFKFDINKGYYNKTTTKDGLNHTVDETLEYPYFEVSLYKMYYDIDSKEELKRLIIDDLLDTVRGLGYTEIADLKRENADLRERLDYLKSLDDCDEEFEL